MDPSFSSFYATGKDKTCPVDFPLNQFIEWSKEAGLILFALPSRPEDGNVACMVNGAGLAMSTMETWREVVGVT